MELQVTVEKHRLPGIAASKGLTNAEAFESHAAGTVLFAGFVGTHIGQQMYEGVLRFEVLGKPQHTRCDFGPLSDAVDHQVIRDDQE